MSNPLKDNQLDIAKVLVGISRFWSGFMGFEYLLGQLFFAIFDLTTTIAGVAGLLVGIFSTKSNRADTGINIFIIACSVLAVMGIAYNAFEYYTTTHSAGNYYPWLLHLSFVISIVIVAYSPLDNTDS